MSTPELSFVIPTYRLRDVSETITQYDQHFWRNGHALRIIVFDDSTPATQENYYSLLEQTCTHNELFYVGPREKGGVPLLSEQATPGRAPGRDRQEPVSPELRRESELHAVRELPDASARSCRG